MITKIDQTIDTMYFLNIFLGNRYINKNSFKLLLYFIN